ncbi:MAG: hypothetical protein RLZZ502_209 [Pseudomonadota bacterium]|jgi:predicted nucleotidyltransferase
MWTPVLKDLHTLPDLELALVFGSFAQGSEQDHSDLDLAVRYAYPLTSEQKYHLIDALAVTMARPIDLIDLRRAGVLITHQAVSKGVKIWGEAEMYAQIASRAVIDYADFAPLVERTLKERQRLWMRSSSKVS